MIGKKHLQREYLRIVTSLSDARQGNTLENLSTPFSWKRKRKKQADPPHYLSDQILKAFFHHTSDAISFSDLGNNIILANQSFENFYGWTLEEVQASPFCFVPNYLIKETRQLFDAVRSMGIHLTNYETVRQRKDGSLVDVKLSASPVRDERGAIIGASCIARDISDRIKAEEALRESEAKYQLLIDHTQDIVTIYNVSLERVYVSPSVEQHLGYTPSEYIKMDALHAVHPEDKPIIFAKQREILSTKQPVQFETRRKDKNAAWVSFDTRGIPILNHFGEVENIMFVSRNVMERKYTEAALLKSEEINRIIAEHTDDLIMIMDKGGRAIFTSPSYERVAGKRFMSSKLQFQHVHPDDQSLVRERYRQMMASQKPCICEFRYQCVDGRWIVLESKGVPILTGDGECDGFIVVSRDITERKNNEDLLRKAEKLSMIGQLAAGIAHEIRNPLTSLKGFIQLLQPTLLDNKMYADIMLSELERINFIVSELLVLAKPQNLQIRSIPLIHLLDDILVLLASEANLKNIRFQTAFTAHCFVLGEENQLKQVFINVMKNSIEAITGHGEIHISTHALDHNRIMVRLSDNGCGVSEDLIPKLGEPFFTTKEKGTGLGLMISSKIIKDHNGTFEISSKINQGTVVEITLPIAQAHIGSS